MKPVKKCIDDEASKRLEPNYGSNGKKIKGRGEGRGKQVNVEAQPIY